MFFHNLFAFLLKNIQICVIPMFDICLICPEEHLSLGNAKPLAMNSLYFIGLAQTLSLFILTFKGDAGHRNIKIRLG